MKSWRCFAHSRRTPSRIAAGIEDGPTELRKASITLCRWLWAFDNENTHPQLGVDGRTLFNSAFHNLQHVCAMAVQLWDTARVSIGRFSEQGNEALNKRLQFELIQRCNNCRVPELNKNMYAIALQNLWRDTFQYQAQRLRKKGACSLCRRCGVGGWTCERHPDCESDEKTPVRDFHIRACATSVRTTKTTRRPTSMTTLKRRWRTASRCTEFKTVFLLTTEAEHAARPASAEASAASPPP